MFESATVHTKVSSDGRIHVDLPATLPPDTEVDVTVSVRPSKKFATREEWHAHVRKVVGSIPDIERPEQLELREIEPL